METRDTRAELRARLLEQAAVTIATEGPGALNLRRLADQAGTSTMAVYTHFGGMDGVRRAVREEGFGRLAASLAQIDQSEDEVADLAVTGLTYYGNAFQNPHLYRAMFMELPLDSGEAELGLGTFDVLVAAVKRCLDSGSFTSGHAEGIATELWALTHGIVALQLAGLLDRSEAFANLGDASLRLFVSYGADRHLAYKALVAAVRRTGIDSSSPAPAAQQQTPSASDYGETQRTTRRRAKAQ